MIASESFRALIVDKYNGDKINRRVTELSMNSLPEGEILIKVEFSSVNYKDAMVANGHPGIVGQFPHIPGIDAVGIVINSKNENIKEGSYALVTGFDMGTVRWGGYSQFVQVPANWVLPLPMGITPEQSMSLGTAGLTASLCVDALIRHDVVPEDGEVLVSGATGGVGSIAAAILSKIGYKVVALTRKPDLGSYMEKLGISRVITHDELSNMSQRTLGKEVWAGAVDTLGGLSLVNILKSVRYGGSVASCGMAAGTDVSTTVFPFILRGVNLLGIDSVNCPLSIRQKQWDRLAGSWKIPCLQGITQLISLEDIVPTLDGLLAGERVGRTVVSMG